MSHKDGRNPGHLHSTVFNDQLVLQLQIISYKEHCFFPVIKDNNCHRL